MFRKIGILLLSYVRSRRSEERKERLRLEEEEEEDVVEGEGDSVLSKDISFLAKHGDTFRKPPAQGSNSFADPKPHNFSKAGSTACTSVCVCVTGLSSSELILVKTIADGKQRT
jgi:hypothetical protein